MGQKKKKDQKKHSTIGYSSKKQTDVKDSFLKKNWFILAVAVVLSIFSIYVIIDNIQNQPITISAKTDDNGNYLIYTIDNKNLTADELYELLYEDSGTSTLFNRYQRLVFAEAVEETEEMKNEAEQNAASIRLSYDEDTLDSNLKSIGYDGADDLEAYCLDILKSAQFMKDYLKENKSDVAQEYADTYNSKTISHILVTVEDVSEEADEDGNTVYTANPTEEEQSKLDSILEALDSGTDFATVAIEYSDDTSASDGGFLGYIDDNTSSDYVSPFAETALALKEGEVSDVITTEYGYHIILCNSTKIDDLYEQEDFVSQVFSSEDYMFAKAILETGESLGISIEDEDLKEKIYNEVYSDESEGTEEDLEESATEEAAEVTTTEEGEE